MQVLSGLMEILSSPTENDIETVYRSFSHLFAHQLYAMKCAQESVLNLLFLVEPSCILR